METFEILVLSLSGLALFYASSMRLIYPVKAHFLQTYLAKPHNDLNRDQDLVNEIRGVGAVMLLAGIIILLGTVVPNLRTISFVVATTIFLGVALGRLISFGLDGPPSPAVVRGTSAEMLLSTLNIFCLTSCHII